MYLAAASALTKTGEGTLGAEAMALQGSTSHVIYGNDGAIACKHRNKNEGCGKQQIFYKGKHAMSFSSDEHKMGAVIGTCYRIQRNSFTDELLIKDLKEKTREWQECLGYKPKFIASALKYLANKHNMENVWHLAHRNIFVGTLS